MQAPGLKIVAPSTADDAKGLIASAIQDPNPVVYMEHKHLYRRIKGEVPEGRHTVPIGKARLAREGTDLTVITYGAMVWTALEATEDIDGASVEVLDLRTLVPLDVDAILESVRKTSKVLLVQEATRSAGVLSEVAAIIGEAAWEDLDGPVRRVSTPDVPIPFSPPLERAVLPQVDDVKEAARELLAY
jgi:2-oxoisovalerate dehydrogenase E1 component beta subunit